MGRYTSQYSIDVHFLDHGGALIHIRCDIRPTQHRQFRYRTFEDPNDSRWCHVAHVQTFHRNKLIRDVISPSHPRYPESCNLAIEIVEKVCSLAAQPTDKDTAAGSAFPSREESSVKKPSAGCAAKSAAKAPVGILKKPKSAEVVDVPASSSSVAAEAGSEPPPDAPEPDHLQYVNRENALKAGARSWARPGFNEKLTKGQERWMRKLASADLSGCKTPAETFIDKRGCKSTTNPRTTPAYRRGCLDICGLGADLYKEKYGHLSDIEDAKSRVAQNIPLSTSPQKAEPPGAGPGSVKSQKVQDLEKKLKDTEIQLAAAHLEKEKAAATVETTSLTKVLAGQQKLIEHHTDKKGFAIKAEPWVKWPTLGDESVGGRDVKDFYDRFEEIVGLANNGQGMDKNKMMSALKGCLYGSRRKVYDNIVKRYKKADGGPSMPEKAYEEVKDRLMRFLKGAMERQMRVKGEWDAFYNTKNMSALRLRACQLCAV